MQVTSIDLAGGLVHTDHGTLSIYAMIDCLGEETSLPVCAEVVVVDVPEAICHFPEGQWMVIDLFRFKLPTLH